MREIYSIGDLRSLGTSNRDPADKGYEAYRRLSIIAANNLGGECKTHEAAIKWLSTVADETSEEGVVQEINACIPLL